jgi:hypothetical protein
MRGVRPSRARGAVLFLLRRVPFTTAVVAVMVIAAVATGAWRTPVETLRIYPSVAFGAPAFADGRWYTLVLGAFFALLPIYYLFVAGGFALLVGFAEYRLGTGRAVLATAGGHLVGVLVAAAVLSVGARASWPWAERVGAMTDVGFSAGMLAAVCVASMTVAAPWGLRLRLGAAAYAGLSLLYVGLMADLEHALAVAAGWSLARVVAGPRAVVQAPPNAGEWRLLGAVGLALVGVLQFAVRLFPGTGPTGSAAHGAAAPLIWHAVLMLVALLAAVGWYRGRRWALPLGIGLVAADLLVAGALTAAALAGALPTWVGSDAPTAYADALAALALAALLVGGARGGRGVLGTDRAGSTQ